MTFLTERLVELRRHIDHLHEIAPRVESSESLRRDMSLHNDVLFSLLMVAQLVVDIAGEMSARTGKRFEDYTHAVRNLRGADGLNENVVTALERLPGFRNVVIHEYVALDLDRVVEALTNLGPIEEFLRFAVRAERSR